MALYIFGIGGTGARVIKALTMLMASGVRVHTERIVPIIIDPDNANGDLNRTLEMLRLYQDIRRFTEHDVNGFFHNEISSLSDPQGGNTSSAWHAQLEGIANNRFKDLIDVSTMPRASQAMTRLLFSEQNLNSDMQVGFKGNPNIGSVVLNKIKDSPVFTDFAEAFAEGDRVLIIGSIFGGTGAAGLPLLIKNLRNAEHTLGKHQLLRDAPIAAISILPYFSVNSGDGVTIDSNTFVSKTKAALSYYAENLCRNNSVNALYYLGDVVGNSIKGADGAGAQRNKAHFIELAAAMAIVHFMGMDARDVATANGKAVQPRYFEYGLKTETDRIQFTHLDPDTNGKAGKSLAQYFLFQKFFRDHYREMPDKTAWMTNGNNDLKLATLNQRLVGDLTRFNQIFDEWLGEMEEGKTPFHPLLRDVGDKDLLNAVVGYGDNRPLVEKVKGMKGAESFSFRLSDHEPKLRALGNSERKLFGLFYNATRDLVENRIKLQNN